MPALLDTNIVIDFMRRLEPAVVTERDHPDCAISVITFMEVLAGIPTDKTEPARVILRAFPILSLTDEIIEAAIVERRLRRLKLPDAMIKATADMEGRVLLTRNTRDFPAGTANVRIPYEL